MICYPCCYPYNSRLQNFVIHYPNNCNSRVTVRDTSPLLMEVGLISSVCNRGCICCISLFSKPFALWSAPQLSSASAVTPCQVAMSPGKSHFSTNSPVPPIRANHPAATSSIVSEQITFVPRHLARKLHSPWLPTRHISKLSIPSSWVRLAQSNTSNRTNPSTSLPHRVGCALHSKTVMTMTQSWPSNLLSRSTTLSTPLSRSVLPLFSFRPFWLTARKSSAAP